MAADQPLDQIITFSVERLGANPTSSASWQLLDGALNRIAGGVMSNDLVLSNAPQGTYYLEVKRSSNAPEYSVAYQINAVESASVCGDGVVEAGEICDGGTYCSDTCQWVDGYQLLTNTESKHFTSANAPFDVAVTAAECASVASIAVEIDIADAWQDELTLTLTSPAGTALDLYRAADGPTQKSLVGRYPDTLTPHGGALSVFEGEEGTGDWVLTVGYVYSTDSTFNSLGIELVCN